MTKEMEKDRLKRELKRLFESMDFVCDHYLNKDGVPGKERERFADIYQQLGQVWEFLALQCKHWDGYKRTREEREIDAEQDSLRFYFLGANWKRRVEHVGAKKGIDPDEALVV